MLMLLSVSVHDNVLIHAHAHTHIHTHTHTLARRLSEEVTVDACILVGETLNLTCISEIGTESDIFDLNMANQGGNFSITSTIDNVDDLNGTFQCSLSNIEGPCGSVRHPFSVRVFGECNDACCQSF